MFFSRVHGVSGSRLLLSTFKAYFSGRKDLFTGLAAGELEKDWIEYPVLSFSLASAKMGTVEELEDVLDEQLCFYERKYGIAKKEQIPRHPSVRYGKGAFQHNRQAGGYPYR